MSNNVLLLDDDELFRKMVLPGLAAKGLEISEASSGKEALELIAANVFDLLIVDGMLPDTEGIKWITRFRASGGTAPIIFISSSWQPVDIYNILTRDLTVAQIIHKPVIPTVFAEQVYVELTRPHWSPVSTTEVSLEDSISYTMAELAREYVEELPAELEKISDNIRDAKETENKEENLHNALLASHKLRGTAGSFGLQSLGETMGRIEDQIRFNIEHLDAVDSTFWTKLETDLIQAFKIAEVRDLPLSLTASQERKDQSICRILVIDEDVEFLAAVEKIARQRSFEVLRATNREEVEQIVSATSIDAVLVDVKIAGYKSFELARTIRELTGEHMPIAFTSNDSSLEERLLAAHMGASLYLNKPIDPDTLEDAVQRLMILGSREHPRVLIVDDDTHFAKRVARLLLEKGMETQTLFDPSQILEKMQSFNPEVLIIDAIMPYISGFDICKMLRTMARWQELPILFVSAQSGLENRIAAFACGADDYIPKPMADDELVTRVSLRVERSRFLKERAERDAVTGLLLRRSFMQRFSAALSSARRIRQPLSLVIFDLDKFKNINDSYGHLAGDSVLSGLGKMMLNRFRAEDLRGRWGGDEFILALVGSDKNHSERLMKNFLDEYAEMEFSSEKGEVFHACLSAGIAEYPSDNTETYDLLRLADQRLYEAKSRGRNCVIAE